MPYNNVNWIDKYDCDSLINNTTLGLNWYRSSSNNPNILEINPIGFLHLKSNDSTQGYYYVKLNSSLNGTLVNPNKIFTMECKVKMVSSTEASVTSGSPFFMGCCDNGKNCEITIFKDKIYHNNILVKTIDLTTDYHTLRLVKNKRENSLLYLDGILISTLTTMLDGTSEIIQFGNYKNASEWYLDYIYYNNDDNSKWRYGYLVQQGTDIYAIKSSFYSKVGQAPVTEDNFLSYGADDLTALTIQQTQNTTSSNTFTTLGSGQVSIMPFNSDFQSINKININ